MYLLLSMVTGTLLAVTFFPNSVMYLLSLILISYFVLAVSEGFRGPVLAAFVISYNIGRFFFIMGYAMLYDNLPILACVKIRLLFYLVNIHEEKCVWIILSTMTLYVRLFSSRWYIFINDVDFIVKMPPILWTLKISVQSIMIRFTKLRINLIR